MVLLLLAAAAVGAQRPEAQHAKDRSMLTLPTPTVEHSKAFRDLQAAFDAIDAAGVRYVVTRFLGAFNATLGGGDIDILSDNVSALSAALGARAVDGLGEMYSVHAAGLHYFFALRGAEYLPHGWLPDVLERRMQVDWGDVPPPAQQLGGYVFAVPSAGDRERMVSLHWCFQR